MTVAYEVARDAARLATGEQWPGGISATMEAKLHRVKNYRRALSTSDKELAALRVEVADGTKKVRQGEMHKKAAEDSTRRLLKVAKDYEKASAEVTRLRLLVSESDRTQHELNARIEASQREAASATAELEAHRGEVAHLQARCPLLIFPWSPILIVPWPPLLILAWPPPSSSLGTCRTRSAPCSSSVARTP